MNNFKHVNKGESIIIGGDELTPPPFIIYLDKKDGASSISVYTNVLKVHLYKNKQYFDYKRYMGLNTSLFNDIAIKLYLSEGFNDLNAIINDLIILYLKHLEKIDARPRYYQNMAVIGYKTGLKTLEDVKHYLGIYYNRIYMGDL